MTLFKNVTIPETLKRQTAPIPSKYNLYIYMFKYSKHEVLCLTQKSEKCYNNK